ncbi:MAG: prolyl oligopeptidase family serine peptidase, partial [Candidatus Heimdallarchaeota archaeon]|nr:prolyl oligopeptidase family serine peptidase [Candidatus Heimdallarchaeota archaeon]
HRPEVDPSRIALFGESFGGAMAISHAARDSRIKCLVVRSPVFDTEVIPKTIAFEDLTKIWTRNEQMRFPVIDLKKGFKMQTMHYNPKNLIKNIKCPICVVVGDNDEILPIAGFKELYSKVSDENTKEFHIIEKANHNFSRNEHLEEMKRIFLIFLETNLKRKSIEMIGV